MTMESLKEIRIAEKRAEEIRRAAEDEVRARIAAARAQAEKLIESADAESYRESAAAINEISDRANALVGGEREKAKRDATTIEAEAARNADDAVKMIYWEIVEKCLHA